MKFKPWIYILVGLALVSPLYFRWLTQKPLFGFNSLVAQPYVVVAQTSTQAATTTRFGGTVSPQVNALYDLGEPSFSWNNGYVSGTLNVATLASSGLTWTNATGTNTTTTNLGVLDELTIPQGSTTEGGLTLAGFPRLGVYFPTTNVVALKSNLSVLQWDGSALFPGFADVRNIGNPTFPFHDEFTSGTRFGTNEFLTGQATTTNIAFTFASGTTEVLGGLFLQSTSTGSIPFYVYSTAGRVVGSMASSSVMAFNGLNYQTYSSSLLTLGDNLGIPGGIDIRAGNGSNGALIIRSTTDTIGTQISNNYILLTNGSATGTLQSDQFNLGIKSNFNRGVFSVDSSGNTSVSGTLTVAGSSLNPVLSATSISFGNAVLIAGACTSTPTTVTGATTSMVALADPVTFPGDGVVWEANVTSANVVTTKVCAIVGLTPGATTYNIRVIQ